MDPVSRSARIAATDLLIPWRTTLGLTLAALVLTALLELHFFHTLGLIFIIAAAFSLCVLLYRRDTKPESDEEWDERQW